MPPCDSAESISSQQPHTSDVTWEEGKKVTCSSIQRSTGIFLCSLVVNERHSKVNTVYTIKGVVEVEEKLAMSTLFLWLSRTLLVRFPPYFSQLHSIE